VTAVTLSRIPGQRAAAQPADHSHAWALVAAAQAGDTTAWDALYRMYSPAVSRYVFARTGHRQITEDLAGDVWVRALAYIHTVKPTSSPPVAWLFTIARNRLMDWRKSAAVSRTMPTDDIAAHDTRVTADPGDLVAGLVADRRLYRALVDELTPEQLAIVVARYFRGMSVEATARLHGYTEGAVKALTYRAIHKLSRRLNRDDFLPTPSERA
jgi:RNA polymerase sigma-70 factor (ECF subfamily)